MYRTLLCLFLCASFPLLPYSLNEFLPTALVARETQESTLEYTLPANATITLTLKRGSVKVETWNQPKLRIITTVRAPTAAECEQLQLEVQQNKKVFSITSNQSSAPSLIDTVLFIPASATCMISITEQGNIQLLSAPRSTKVHTLKGDIQITTLTDGSINATTEKGSLEVICEAFSPVSSLLLASPNGAIALQLPLLINARLDAQSQGGRVTSDIPITLDPITTKLNTKSWQRLRRSALGTIGEGGDAPITLRAKGNITITTFDSYDDTLKGK